MLHSSFLKSIQCQNETRTFFLKRNGSPCMDYTNQNFEGKDSNAKFISCAKTRIWPKFQETINCSIAGKPEYSVTCFVHCFVSKAPDVVCWPNLSLLNVRWDQRPPPTSFLSHEMVEPRKNEYLPHSNTEWEPVTLIARFINAKLPWLNTTQPVWPALAI